MSCSYYSKHVIDCKICMTHLWYPLISRMFELMNNILIHNYTFTSANMQIYKHFSRMYAQAVDLLSKCCVYMNFTKLYQSNIWNFINESFSSNK